VRRCCLCSAQFEADNAHQCRAWPFGYRELAPFYEEAEALLGVRTFMVVELPSDRRRVARTDAGWREQC
jgi:choline dehydrogenase-like flavoprotein